VFEKQLIPSTVTESTLVASINTLYTRQNAVTCDQVGAQEE
jgi:hypothetical protein